MHRRILKRREQLGPSVVRGVETLVDDCRIGSSPHRELGVRSVACDDLDTIGNLRLAGSVDGPRRKACGGELIEQGEADGPGAEHDVDLAHATLLEKMTLAS